MEVIRKKPKIECFYLSQIQRHLIDFDLIPQCSVCLSKLNIYCCLACGKFFEGSGNSSHAYLHSLEKSHNLYISTFDCSVISLPENIEVNDDSLDDLKFNIFPHYSCEVLEPLQKNLTANRSVEGQSYIVGLIALNNLKSSAFANVVIYLLNSIIEIREKLLLINYQDKLTNAVAKIVKKMWNQKSLKSHVCPHELFFVIDEKSNGKFNALNKKDPQLFFTWIINQMKIEKQLEKIIKKNLMGIMRIEESVSKFLLFKIELPLNHPFKSEENSEKMSLEYLVQDYVKKKGIKILKVPKYFVIFFQVFQDNGFFIEKSRVSVEYGLNFEIEGEKYGLVASVSVRGEIKNQSYQANVFHIDKFYEIDDLVVNPIVDQLVVQKVPYILLYKQIPK